jgi:glycosyltransferase involved in cell wall biosynthesis
LERSDNRYAIMEWLQNAKLDDRVQLNLLPMKHSDFDGNHRSRLHFALDLKRLYLAAVSNLDQESVVWKSGQVNFIFNLPFLLLKRPLILGPVSGFEYPPVWKILKYGYRSLFVKYAAYLTIIALGRQLYKALISLRAKPTALLLATPSDCEIFRSIKGRAKAEFFVELISEVDIESVLRDVPCSKLVDERQKKKVFLWSGALNERKNPATAVKIFCEVLNLDPNAEVLLIGNGPLKRIVEESVSDVASERMKYLETLSRKDFLRTLKEVDAVLVTSWREVNSVFVFEAFAAGCSVVSSDVSGMSDTVSQVGTVLSFEQMFQPKIAAEALLREAENGNPEKMRSYLISKQRSEKAVMKKVLQIT